jgi:hypothetical protein
MVSIVAILIVGCAAFPNDKRHLEAAIRSVEKRTAFDMDCEEVSSNLLGDITRLGQQMTSMSIGVIGCNKKATYYTECVNNIAKLTCTPTLNTITKIGKSSETEESD